MSKSRRPSGVPLPPGFRRRESERPDLGWSFPEPMRGSLQELGSQPPPRASERPSSAPGKEPNRNTYAPAQILLDRREAPTDHSLLRYWERLLYVGQRQTPAQLETSLLVELERLRRELLPAPAGQFVQLALFDHEFEAAPSAPPIATLSWKDWEGAPEIWVRGKWRSGPRSRAPGAASPPEPSSPEPSSPEPSISPTARNAQPPATPDWATPEQRHEVLPEAPDPPGPAPDSQGAVNAENAGGAELVGRLFERMHEMLYLDDTGAGAQYVLATIARCLPSAGVLIHLYDSETSSFVLARAQGPHSQSLLLSRTPSAGSHLEKVLRQNQTRPLTAEQGRRGLWARLGVAVAHGLCAPVREGRKYLGAIELGRAAGEPAYTQEEVHALDYICEQFASFLSQRPLELEGELLLPRG